MEEDLKCAPRLPSCGTQHPHRALGGTRVLLAAAGVPAELVRMSCGLESSEDLIADIAQALDKIYSSLRF